MSPTNQQKAAMAASYEAGSQERADAAKIAKLNDSFTSAERERSQIIRTTLEINLAKAFGTKLPEICVNRLLDRALLDGDVYTAIVSGQDVYLPQTNAEWQTYVKTAVTADEFANAAIINADYVWKSEVRQQALANLSGPEKLAKERAGHLNEFLDAKVREAEVERSGF